MERRRFSSLSPALVLAAAVGLSACRTEIAHDVSEADANRLVALLAESGIAAHIEAAGTHGERASTVLVPAADAARARIVLSHRELPTKRAPGLAEVFDRTALVPTPTEEQARLVQALQGELSTTLESVEGVVAARVHLSLPGARRGLLDGVEPPAPPSASVVFRYRGEAPTISEEDVRSIVSGAVADLSPERVTVVTIADRSRAELAEAAVVPVGPFSVSSASAGALLAWLVGSSLAVGLLGLALVVVVLRLRALRRQGA